MDRDERREIERFAPEFHQTAPLLIRFHGRCVWAVDSVCENRSV